jgi:hypothetical protein
MIQSSSKYDQRQFVKPVLFVTGVMRSGTTLLHRILTHSSKSEYTLEIDSLRVLIESFRTLDHHNAFAPLDRAQYVQLYREFLTLTFNACAAQTFGTKLVLKDPLSLTTLASFHELAPDVKFVVSVRNPLATVTSIYRVRNRQLSAGKQSFISEMSFGDVVDYVDRLGDIILSMRDRANVLVVRYEDLVAREARIVANLGRFAGTGIDLDLADTSSTYDPAHPFWTAESGRPIETSSLHKHKDELNSEQSDLMIGRLVRFREVFGYAET